MHPSGGKKIYGSYDSSNHLTRAKKIYQKIVLVSDVNLAKSYERGATCVRTFPQHLSLYSLSSVVDPSHFMLFLMRGQ
jgi:hypothetical protein